MTEIIDIDINLKDRTTVVKQDNLKRTLYYNMGKIQSYKFSINYVVQIMFYLRTISEQHLSVYEVLVHKLEQFIEALSILNTGHSPLTLTSPPQLKYMLDPVKKAL